MIKLDDDCLEKILDTPLYDLDVSPSALKRISGFITGHLGAKATEENMRTSAKIAHALLLIGFEWGLQSSVQVIEEMQKEKRAKQA